jgi:hypothetical protein
MKKTVIAFLCAALAQASSLGAEAQVIQKVLAKVGSQIITTFEVEQAAKAMEPGMSATEAQSPAGQKKLADDKAKALDRMIEEKLVILAAEKGPEGFKEAQDKGTAPANPYLPTALEVDEELDKAFDDARSRFSSQDDFEQELRNERLSVAEFRNSLRERLRSEMTFARMIKAKQKEFQPDLRVADGEAKAYFDAHQADFAVGQQVNLRHILFKAGDQGKAESVAEQLKASQHAKEDFIQAAKKYSKDELSASNGGRLDWIEKGGLRWKEVEDKAFSMKPGEIAGPIKSSDGLHIIYVEDSKAGEQKAFEDVKAQVTNMVYQQKMQKRIQDWVEDLKHEFFVQRNDG